MAVIANNRVSARLPVGAGTLAHKHSAASEGNQGRTWQLERDTSYRNDGHQMDPFPLSPLGCRAAYGVITWTLPKTAPPITYPRCLARMA